jgi:hypothetical protein
LPESAEPARSRPARWCLEVSSANPVLGPFDLAEVSANYLRRYAVLWPQTQSAPQSNSCTSKEMTAVTVSWLACATDLSFHADLRFGLPRNSGGQNPRQPTASL